MNVCRWLLLPLSAWYGVAVRARNRHYDRNPDAATHPGVPVISVGNLTVGGTGKTPLVIDLVRRLRALDRRPAILTRGYRGTQDQAADEVLEFRAALPDTPVIVAPDRVAGAATARAAHDIDCLVLDDGFQHRRLARDLDLVLIDALRPWGGGHVLPAGRLREPLNGLRRAQFFVITRVNQVPPANVEIVHAVLRRYGGHQPVAHTAVHVDQLVAVGGTTLAPSDLSCKRVLTLSGIGNPDSFEQMVTSTGAVVARALRHRDHHRYARADVSRAVCAAREANADFVVTTRKDWVKLRPLWTDVEPPLVRVDLRLDWKTGSELLDEWLRRTLESAQ